MTIRKLNGPLGGDYLTDGRGNAVLAFTNPITDDNDIGGRVSVQRGRSFLSLYDDFSTYANGSPSGGLTSVGGLAWATTGAVAPTVSSGMVSANGSGYLYTTDPSKPFLMGADVSFGGAVGTAPITLAFSREGGGAAILDHLAHLIVSCTGYTLTVRQDGGTFYEVLGGTWPDQLVPDGTVYHVALSVTGDTAAVYGPHGEVCSARDPRLASVMDGNDGSLFWQGSTNGATEGYLHRVWAISRETSGVVSVADYIENIAGGGMFLGDRLRLIGSRYTIGEVLIGDDPASGYASIRFGAAEIRTKLTDAVNASDTTFVSDRAMPSGCTLKIGIGDDEETLTTTGLSSGSAPEFTTTTTGGFAAGHPAGTPVVATVPSGQRGTIIFNPGAGMLQMPSGTWINASDFYFRGDLSVNFTSPAANVAGLGDGDSWDLEGTYNGGNLRLRDNYIWVDGSGRLRIKSSAPSSDTDGTVVGTQS